MKKSLLLFAGMLGAVTTIFAQDGYNPLSVRPVHTSDQMYQKTITRAIDLRETQNDPLFARNREITALLVNGVANGVIKAYENDSLTKQVSAVDFSRKLLASSEAVTDTVDNYLEYGPTWREILKDIPVETYMARDLYQMEIKEAVLFDK